MNVCNTVFVGTHQFKFDRYGVINTSFGFIQKLKNSIRIINTSKRNTQVRCACGKCRLITNKVDPWEKISNIPARVYGDVIRFKMAGYKNIRIITCNETKNKLPIIRLNMTLYKKQLNIKKYILPFGYIKYKSNVTVISKSYKHFEFILHEEKVTVPTMNCCIFDHERTDNKAVYIMMLMVSAQLGGKKVWHTFNGRKNLEYVFFNV